tara:strand:+ start:369 stop:650 length:282 start_codon:yes stop_codon:yes gene_type:complete
VDDIVGTGAGVLAAVTMLSFCLPDNILLFFFNPTDENITAKSLCSPSQNPNILDVLDSQDKYQADLFSVFIINLKDTKTASTFSSQIMSSISR